MRSIKLIFPSLVLVAFAITRCAPIETIAKHDFSSGSYKLKTAGSESSRIYADVNGDSLTIYSMEAENPEKADEESARQYNLSDADADNELSKATFVRNSIDFDLSTIIARLRPSQAGVPAQLNANLNAVLYLGARKDYFFMRQHKQVFRSIPYLRQIGFDAGLFAGMGITFISPTNTAMRSEKEYDGIIFQKGAALFFTFDKISVGIASGFDTLMGPDSKIWIYNNKPWIGLVLGIANF
jgi:hypothetical protein